MTTPPGAARRHATPPHLFARPLSFLSCLPPSRPSASRPEALFVSGRRAPTVPRADRLHLETDDCLVAELRRQVTALVGDADPRVTPAEAAAWGDHTTASFGLEVFSGGHFYLTEHQEKLAALLRSRLTSRV